MLRFDAHCSCLYLYVPFTVLVLLRHMNYPSGQSIKDYLKFMFLFKSLWLTYDSVCFILGASNSVWIPLHPRHADVGAGRAVGDKSDNHTHSTQRSARCFEIRTERLPRAFFYHSSHTHMTFVCRAGCNIMTESVQRYPRLNIYLVWSLALMAGFHACLRVKPLGRATNTLAFRHFHTTSCTN